jgi:5-oxopent-3-ene-1,2,5-tricarboxylate decarboxylase / 2-hydroxyhepta-2,4-diene-1,7-dioate isomerase
MLRRWKGATTLQSEPQMESKMSQSDVPQAILDRFKKVATATVYFALAARGITRCFMEDVQCMIPGRRLAGRARTLRTVPTRPDLRQQTFAREHSPEYRAMSRCGRGDVLVVDCMRIPFATVLGDIKLLQLKHQEAEGFVSDGAIRDFDVVSGYGFAIYAQRRTPTVREYGEPIEVDVDIQCAGVLVRPGDVLVGDNDGVVVVPAGIAAEIVEWAEVHEEAEEIVKARIEAERCVPGVHYPPTEELKESIRRRRAGA